MDEEFVPPEHRKKFKGWWFPAPIVKLYEDKKLTPHEFILLGTIDSLVDTEIGIPCYAGNKFLMERTHVKDESTLQKMLKHLKELGVLVEVGFDGRKRYLETSWSQCPDWNRKTPEQKQALIKKQGKAA